MDRLVVIGADLVAIAILAYGLYFRRHRRSDLALAYVVVNVGVLAVASVLASSAAGLGLGLGLFGVLSIIRLRSTEIDQREVAYYFSALALGLIAGLASIPDAVSLSLMALIIGAIAVVDHPRALGRYRQQTIHLDRAVTDEAELTAQLTALLGAAVHRVQVRRVDLVNDTTLVDVRYELPRPSDAAASPRVDRERIEARDD